MSRRRVYSGETLAVMDRFFTAFGLLVEAKRIRSVNHYCVTNGIDRRHFYAQQKDRGRGFFEVSWLLPLVRGCGVSPRWLLTGEGKMIGD